MNIVHMRYRDRAGGSRVFVTSTVKGTARMLRIESDANVLAVEYGRLVREAREAYAARLGRSFTADDLGRRASLPSGYVEGLESATTKRTPTLEVMYRIARVLRKHPAELLPILAVH